MRCVITGVETENKYQNIPVSTDAIKAAKKFQELEPWLSLKQAIEKLNRDYFEMMKKQLDGAKTSCSDQEKIRNG